MRHRFEVLDAWRGIAAVMVALFHLIIGTHIRSLGVVANAGSFVDFFFVLSGFVISYAYMDELKDSRSVASFVIRRFGRLWPLHVTILGFLVLREAALYALSTKGVFAEQTYFSGGTGIPQLVEHLFFLQAVGFDHTHSWNGTSWSISTEFWTYMVFAIGCVALRGKATIAFAGIAVAGAVVVAVFSPTFLSTSFEFGMARCLFGFFVGHLTYRIWKQSKGVAFPVVTEVGALALIVGYVWFTPLLPPNPWTMIAPIVFAVGVWVFAFEAGPVSRAMKSRWLLFLGALSYSIYMIHDSIAFTVEKVVNGCAAGTNSIEASAIYRMTCLKFLPSSAFSNPWVMDLVAIVYLGVVICIATVTYRFIEVPGRAYFNNIAKKVAGPPHADAPVPPVDVASPAAVIAPASPQ